MRELAIRLALLLCAFAFSRAGLAHELVEGSASASADLGIWQFDPGVLLSLGIASGLYAAGLRVLWARRVGRGVSHFEVTCYWTGWLSLYFALCSPVHALGAVLFSAHMTQHEILMLVAAPLMVVGKPGLVTLAALPRKLSARLARTVQSGSLTSVWRKVTSPQGAWLIHALALWVWHVPSLFDATLHSEFVHALQHLSFFLSAVLFWWAVIHGRRRVMGFGFAVLYMFTTAMHSGLLGALLTLSRHVWYTAYSAPHPELGLSPLQDQQLGGLIMWVPAGLVYVIAGLAFFAGWLRESGRRAARYESTQLATAVS